MFFGRINPSNRDITRPQEVECLPDSSFPVNSGMKRRYVLISAAVVAGLAVALAVVATYFPWPVDCFLVDKEPHQAYPGALIQGRLFIENGVVRLRSPFPAFGFLVGPVTTPVWPNGFSIRREGVRTIIRNEKGEFVAAIGDFVHGAAGEVERGWVETMIGKPLSAKCRGSFSIVSSVELGFR